MNDEGAIRLDPETRAVLEDWARSSPQQRVVRRSRIVLLLAGGLPQIAVSAQLGVSRRTVGVWRKRFVDGGAHALLHDRPGRGRPKGRQADAVKSILAATANPPDGQARWTARALARHVGVSHSTVLRVWRDASMPEPSGCTG